MDFFRKKLEAQPSNPDDPGGISELIGLSTFLENQDHIELGLKQLAEMVSTLLGCANCSIMLLKEEDVGKREARLRVYAHHGVLPEEAYRGSMRLDQGIAGKVVASGQPLLIEDIEQSCYAHLMRGHGRGGLISVPISIGERVVGVLNASRPRQKGAFTHEDLKLACIVALMIGKSVQVFQLQHLLHSNFIQLSLARENGNTPRHAIKVIVRNGMKMARILGRTFFREMRNAGFGDDHILAAATEIIHMLNCDLKGRRKVSLRQSDE